MTETGLNPLDGAAISARKRRRRWNWLIAAGILVRLVISFYSVGTNDALAWTHFGEFVNEVGLFEAYKQDQLLNHPPLMVLYAKWIWNISGAPIPFSFDFRFLPILADVLTCRLLVWIGTRPDRPARGHALAAAFAWSPVAILVSGYHTNTDSLYVALSLLATYLVATTRPFLAGLALGAALNVKLIPLFLVAPLLAATGSWRRAIRMVGGLALMALPFVPLVIGIGPTIKRNMLDYNSDVANWGFVFFTRTAIEQPRFRAWAEPMQDAFRAAGRYVILGVGIALAIASTVKPKRWNAYAMAAMAYSGFLIFSPGFSVQYLLCAVPFLLAVDLRRGLTYGAWAGAFLTLQYCATLTEFWPLLSYFRGPPILLAPSLFGLLAWTTLIAFVWHTLTVDDRVPHEDPPPVPQPPEQIDVAFPPAVGTDAAQG